MLSRPEFAGAQPRWWQRLLQWIFDLLDRTFETVGAGGRGSVIGVAVLLLVAAAVVLVVVRMTRSVRRDPGRDLALDVGIGRTPREWIAESAEHERAGRWRDAVRCRYRAQLAELAAAGLVDEIAGRTSGEYLAAVRADVPTAADAFSDVTRRFETAWYGHGDTTAEDVRAFAQAAARVTAAARGRRLVTAGP